MVFFPASFFFYSAAQKPAVCFIVEARGQRPSAFRDRSVLSLLFADEKRNLQATSLSTKPKDKN
jgi:hypothetical protein